MIHLFSSNTTEDLIERLLAQLEAQRQVSGLGLFEVVHVLTSTRTLGTHIKMEVAQHSGIAANIRFSPVLDFLRGLLREQHPEALLLDHTSLQILFQHILSSRERLAADPELESVRRYLGGDELRDDLRDQRVVQLAEQLATLFEGYLHNRGLMLDAWGRGEDVFKALGAAANHERWQRALWRMITTPNTGALDAMARRTGRRYLTARDLVAMVARGELELPRLLHMVGMPELGTLGYRLIEAIGERVVLFAYHLNPCQEYWWDMRFGRPEEEQNLFSSLGVDDGTGDGLSFSSEDMQDDFWTAGEEAPVLLRLWGFSGAHHLRALQQLEQLQPDDHFAPADEHDALLNRMQRDLLAFERPALDGRVLEDDDRSLQIVGAPSVHREVEIIASEIWALVRAREEARAEDPSIEPLRLNDIAVLVNHAQRDVYQTTIRAVFYDSHSLPFNMIDMAALQYSRAIEAVQLLLTVPFGQFKRQEFLRLLTHPNVQANFPHIDPQDWLVWCDELKILHGADRRDHADTYIEDELFHWDQGLRRLTLGAFMTGQLAGDRRVFRLGPREYLPHEYGQESLTSAARLVLMARSLIEDARFCRNTRLPLADWATFGCRMISTYIAAAEDEDELNLHRCRHQIAKLADMDLTGEPISYRAACGMMLRAMNELEVKKGQHLVEGVVVASLLPDRPLPFKVIFVAGMNEGTFPEPDARRPEDLRFVTNDEGHIVAPPGTLPDMATRDTQRWTLLEAFTCARERLYLSYVSRDTRTGEPLEPSSVVNELLYTLEQDYLPFVPGEDDLTRQQRTRERFVTTHELRRYHERYFPSVFQPLAATQVPFLPTLELAPSAQPEAENEARARALRHDLHAHLAPHDIAFPSPQLLRHALQPAMWEQLRDELGLRQAPLRSDPFEQDVLRVSTFDIRSFLECPLQGSARFLLRLGEEYGEDVLGAESELFETSARARMRLLRDVFTEKLAREHVEGRPFEFGDIYDGHARYFELAGQVPTGPFYRAARQKHLRTLERWQENLPLFGLGRSPKMEVRRFGRRPERDVDIAQDPLMLEVRVPDRERPVRVELSGNTEILLPSRPASLIPSTSTQSWSVSPKYFMRGFLDHAILSARGQVSEQPWQVILNPNEEAIAAKHRHCIRRFKPLSQESARDFLTSVVHDMLTRVHAYYMPIEAVFEFKQKGEAPIQEIVDRQRGSAWETTSADFGPVSNPERFEAPDDAMALIDERYGLFFEHLIQDGR